MKEEIIEFLRDRFAQRSNATYISLSVIFSILSASQENTYLFKLGLFIFFLAIISSNSIYILISEKVINTGILDRNGNQTETKIPRYPKLHFFAKSGLVFSAIMLFGGFFSPMFPGNVSQVSNETPTSTVTPTYVTVSPSPILNSPTSTYTLIPTFTPTTTSTFTITPSLTPTLTATSTINPMVYRGLDQACLSRSLWTPYFYNGESEKVDSRNCWDLTEWGFIPQNNGLSIVVKDSDLGQDITRRLYTKIKGDTEIIFTVRIDQITTKLNFDGIFMMGVGNSSNVLNSGYYLKYTVVENEKKVYRETGTGLKIYNNPRSEYTLGESQNIIIRITGTQAKIIVDGTVIRSTILSPDEHSVFWIVYSLPSNNGSLIAEITDFQIYDHR